MVDQTRHPSRSDTDVPALERRMARRGVLTLAAALPLVPAAASAASGGAVVVTPESAHPPRVAPADHFTGVATVSSPFQATAPARTSGATVTFEARARTAWHTHPLGQTLVVLSGSGLVQRWGDPAQRIGPGDVVWIPPDVKHWHGAAPSSPMAHVAIGEVLDGKTVDWAELVSDNQYASASNPVAP